MVTIKNAGWHLSYFGDLNFIINKIKSFSHEEYNTEYYLDKEKIAYNLKHNLHLFNSNDRHFQYIPLEENTYLPGNLDTLLKFVNTFLQDS